VSSEVRSSFADVVTPRPHLHGVPPISERAVPRPRVTDSLVARIGRHVLVHVVAPAGSGKTTAVVQAVQRLDHSATWLILDEWHRSPGKLLEDLAGALERVAPGLTRELGGGSDAGPVERAAVVGSFVRRRRVVLVVDDCHLLRDAPEGLALLAALARRGAPGLHVVLVGRTALPLPGLGVEAMAPEAIVGDELLRATPEEAAEVLGARGSSVEVDEALRATGGWVAGLVFETWRTDRGGPPDEDPLRDYLEREVLPRLEPEAARALVAASVFDEVDHSRARALGVDDPSAWFSTLREAGLPAVWGDGGSRMRLHPRIREVLHEELDTGDRERRREALRSATAAYEQEGLLERALELSLESGDTEVARRLLPEVISDVVDRHDVALAERYLTEVGLEPEPARVALARLALASLRFDLSGGLAVIDRLRTESRLTEIVREEPAIGALASLFLMGGGRFDAAFELVAAMPPGRARDVGKIMLSLARDDPGAPTPPFRGDVLDAVLARSLYHRGHLRELREGRTAWAESTGAHEINAHGESVVGRAQPGAFLPVLAQFSRAIDLRDRETATQCVAALESTPWYQRLSDVELAVRLERDAGRARAAVERMREHPLARALVHSEWIGAWDGASHLLADDAEGAAEVLREAIASMRRGDRILMLPSALVYLAEAEWRLGNEEASDRAADDAYGAARRQGSLRNLLLALADFPGVLSRRVDAEPGVESPWHSLGRALIADSRRAGVRIVTPASVHLREFGDPALVVEGHVVRPKIRKSLELLSYLLASASAEVSREEVLNALWNGRNDDSTRAYLRQALRHLRDVLPVGVAVQALGDALALEGAITSESLEFEALLAAAVRDPGPESLGYLLEALELVGRGLFLEGSQDVNWIDDRRAQIASIVSDVRLDAAELLLSSDRHLRALALVDEALDLEPLSERAWRLRMRALGLLGDYDGVTTAYVACASALAEIGLEPSRATSELARSLRR